VGPDALSLALQEGARGLELPSLDFAYLGTRAIVGITMLIHMIFAQLFVGFIVASPLLQWFGRRRGDDRMRRLSGAMDRFNVLTFSIGATFAGMFIVLIIGFYPRVTATLFTHFFWLFPMLGMAAMGATIFFLYLYHYRTQRQSVLAGLAAALFILIWQAILTGVDTFMVTGGGPGERLQSGGNLTFSSLGEAVGSMLNPMFIPLDLHRTFGNLSWPAFAVAGWAAFAYGRAKKPQDREFFDWAGSMGVLWGTVFLLLQPFAGFVMVLTLELLGYGAGGQRPSGPYHRLVGAGSESFTSTLLYINLLMVVGLFVLSNLAMYAGSGRNPEARGRRSIRLFGLIAAAAGLYSVSPVADWPFLYVRYIMLLIMVLATLGSLVVYIRVRRTFVYGRQGGAYRVALLLLGVLAVATTMGMGFMKSNSRVPYTIYGQSGYGVGSERPVTQEQLRVEP
jgi:cytochrome d ubiquinol oxidase subunit I